MKQKINYSFSTSERAFEPMLKKLKVHHVMDVDWIDYDPNFSDDEEVSMVHIRFPNAKHPELTKSLFFEVVCMCHQRYYDSMFIVDMAVINEDGEEAVGIKDVFRDGTDKFDGRFSFKGELFAEDLQKTINEVRKIVNKR